MVKVGVIGAGGRMGRMLIQAVAQNSQTQLAAAIGRPKAVRAAGSANGANNVAVLIPCHRVIATGGGLGGYAYGLEIKRKLLGKEGVQTKE